MSRPTRLAPLAAVLALVLALAAPPAARAASAPVTTDLSVPKPVRDWLKRNALAMYIVFDEVMDDLFGGCPPPAPEPLPSDPPPHPW